MFRKRLYFQILTSVLITLLSGILILYYLSSNEIKETIDKKQFNVYTEKIDTILQTIESKYQKLQRTLAPQSYEYAFKELLIKELKKVHYTENMKIYPFIINEKRFFILHPNLSEENYNTYAENKEYKKIINVKEGNFNVTYRGIDKWIIFKHYKNWDWIIGYSIPTNLKYKSLHNFNDKFLMTTIVILSIISILIILIVRYILSPIEKLIIASKKITKGDLKSDIKINGSYELTQLSNSFSIMKDTIKKQIDELEDKIEERTKELKCSNNELQETIINLKQTQTKLIEAEKMASLGGLVAGVAHEINTPIGIGLTGATHLMDINKEVLKDYEQGQLSEERFKSFLEDSNDISFQITRNLERTADLVKSFKQVAVDQSSEDKREFELKSYVEEILTSLDNIIKKTKITIKVECKERVLLNSYAGAYAQIFTNLIINSINHGFNEKQEGNITISIVREDKTVNIIYKDNGKGIKEENLTLIFEPFFTTNRSKGGTGLGLNIIYNIITTQLKGSIECSSKEGKGVSFLIKLPLT